MIRLLYIDASPEMRDLISAVCERLGQIQVKALDSGEAALDWLLVSPTDVIVSDYRFPRGIDGITLLGRLRTRGDRTPFILFTADTSRALKDDADKNGAFRVVHRTPQGKNPVLSLIRTVCWALTDKD